MLNFTLNDLSRLENRFYEFCLLYFDDLPDGKTVAIKLPFPPSDFTNLKLSALTRIFEFALLLLFKYFFVKKRAYHDYYADPAEDTGQNRVRHFVWDESMEESFISSRLPLQLNPIRSVIFGDRFT